MFQLNQRLNVLLLNKLKGREVYQFASFLLTERLAQSAAYQQLDINKMEEYTVDDINGFVHADDADSDFYKLN